MCSIDIGVGHYDDLFVSQRIFVKGIAGAAAECLFQVLDFLVSVHLVGGGARHIEDFAAQG